MSKTYTIFPTIEFEEVPLLDEGWGYGMSIDLEIEVDAYARDYNADNPTDYYGGFEIASLKVVSADVVDEDGAEVTNADYAALQDAISEAFERGAFDIAKMMEEEHG